MNEWLLSNGYNIQWLTLQLVHIIFVMFNVHDQNLQHFIVSYFLCHLFLSVIAAHWFERLHFILDCVAVSASWTLQMNNERGIASNDPEIKMESTGLSC